MKCNKECGEYEPKSFSDSFKVAFTIGSIEFRSKISYSKITNISHA